PPAYTTNGAVWPNYDLVWHLEQSAFPYLDSTRNDPALDGDAPVQTQGIVGNGQQFNGSSTYLDAGVVNLNNAFTLSAWVDIPFGAYSCQGIWANQQGGYGSAGLALFVNKYQTTNGAVLLDAGDGGSGSEISTTTNLITPGRWHLVTAAINRAASSAAFYVDGNPEPIVSGSAIVADFANNADLNFGRFTNSALYLEGAMDEARIYGGIEDSNWVWASWATVASNSLLQSYSAIMRSAPSLSVGVAGAIANFVWPATGVGYALFTATNLTPPVSWSPAGVQPLLTNNQWQISLPYGNTGSRFYRLQSQ
ncbi:MAG: LamG-like jellyroll fold domain-containing protein, partial [Limisphaerales bacterium]